MSDSPDRKHVKQVAAKGIKARGNVTIGKIVQIANQTINQIVKPAYPRSPSVWLAQGGLVIALIVLLVAAIKGGFSSSNSLSTTYAPSTTVENKNTFLINSPPPSLLNNSSPTQVEKKDAQQKISQYQQEVQKNPDSAVAHTNLGEALRRTGDLESAGQEQQKALQLNPNLQEAKVGLALIEQDKGNVTVAKQKIQEALGQEKSAFTYIYLAAILYFQNPNDLKSVETALRKAIELDADDGDYHTLLAGCLQEQGRISEAITEYREAIRKGSKDRFFARYGLGSALHNQGKLDEAIIEYRKAISINSNNEEVRLDLARALLRKSQWELAITECREATRLNPNNATAHVLWGYTLVKEMLQGELQQDKIEEASKHFKKARDLFRTQGKIQEADKLDEYLAR